MTEQLYLREGYGRNDFDDELEVRKRWWHPQAGDVVLDVGAAIGSYTLPALAAGATVYAFCPQRIHRPQLIENVNRNSGFAERCTVLDYGLYNQAGWLTCDGSAYHFVEQEPAAKDDETLQVRVLDEALQLDRLDWIKMDIEGSELAAIHGAEQTIRKHRPKILVENHLFMNPLLETMIGRFLWWLDIGYTMQARPWLDGSTSHSFFEVRK